jgi:hypothetical protein
LVSLALAVILLIAATVQLDFINTQRKNMRLVVNEPLENAPPSLAFATVAMGAFRGLVVDILWLRADRLKEAGQFFDAKQLAEWITTLQPRFAAVWEFHSWNMAYNISVTIPSSEPEQRWRWVKNGYELLRDKAIPLNPKSLLLYRQLGLIFQHKIGGVTDDVHKYYKLQLAKAMEPLLSSQDNQLSTSNQYFEALVEAPARWEQIAKDPNVAPLIAALKRADKVFEDESAFVGNYLALRQNPQRFAPAAFDLIDRFRETKALKKFDIFAKAYQLRNLWKLEPELMVQLNQTFGPIDWSEPNRHLPLDWRHPETHAMYWAVKGLQMAGKGVYSVDETNTDRLVGHSLQNLFFGGKMFIHNVPIQFAETSRQKTPLTYREPATQLGDVFLRPDLRMFVPCNKARLDTLKKYKDLKETTYISLQHGHQNFLKNAVFMFYQAGHRTWAKKVYDQLRDLYYYDEYGNVREELKLPLVDYIRWVLEKKLKDIGYSDAKRIVQMLLRESYFRYAVRDDDEAFGNEKMAKEVCEYYRKKYLDENRIDLPELALIRYTALLDFLNDEQYPMDLRLALRERIKIERPQLSKQLELQEQKMLKEVQDSQQQP